MHDLLELTKKSREREREKKKPCECWNEETSRNPKQYAKKITTKWEKNENKS